MLYALTHLVQVEQTEGVGALLVLPEEVVVLVSVAFYLSLS